MILRLCACVLFITACVDDKSSSTQASSGSGSDHPFMPPKEAVDACASATVGDTCSFDINGHHIDGTCRNGPDGSGPLACVPPPPPAAIDACASSSAGDTCAFDFDGHHVDGTCRNGPDGTGPLACAPDQPPPPL